MPTAMAVAPDGRLFVAEQAGTLRVIRDGVLLPTPFLTVTVSSAGERGLLGVAFHPAFETNGYVYVYYTATSPTIHNRVSRFTASGDTAVPASETVILELETLSSATIHNGGAIHFGGDDINRLSRAERRRLCARRHLVFQDPYSSLAPTMRVDDLIAEPMVIHSMGTASERRAKVAALLDRVELPARYSARRAGELSGGERQRVALARALIGGPELIVADEPTGMLDAQLRSGLIAVMASLATSDEIAIVFITHDLALTAGFSDRIVALHDGGVVDDGPTLQVLCSPGHPSTRALVDASIAFDRALAPRARWEGTC